MPHKKKISFGIVIALLIIVFGVMWYYKNHPFPNGKCTWDSQCAPLLEEGGQGAPTCVDSECQTLLNL